MGDREPQRLQEAAHQLNRYAFRHATPILIAPPGAAPADIRNASGFLLRLGHHTYLGTAWHVVQHWIGRRAEDNAVLFQAGAASFAPESVAWRDEANDLVFLNVTDDQRGRIDASVCEPLPVWPPADLAAGNDIFVCGFPGQIRQHLGPRDLNFRGFSAQLIVEHAGERSAACVLDQDYLTDIHGNRTPTAELNLGGMSGGPAFLVGQVAYPLVALVRANLQWR